MSLRTDMLVVADDLRSLRSPSNFDVALHQLTVRTRTWSGAPGVSASVDSDLVLHQYYPVKSLSAREVAASGGRYREGDMKMMGITPSNGAGVGYTEQELRPAPTEPNIQVLYLLLGPMGGEYALLDADFSQAFSYEFVLRRMETTP
jgi:hypothetical protein